MSSLAQFSGDWDEISALLDEALSLPAEAHADWLASLTGERANHVEALHALLGHRARVETDDFLGHLPALPVAADASANESEAGTRVGAYRLIAEIGRGGMGTVWLAERADGLMQRRVALKLPRMVWGGDFAERLGREREILASLEHEHIARLYDAGVDSLGRPYLAMELVEGESIDAYCRSRTLPLAERIALLLQVMAAVAHAHARLVVHRDLKPGNILVTPDSQVKLLDFGIAKLLEGDRTRETALTQFGGRALTLDYASPEQIRGEPLGTASDVYSLAVVAYEIVAGSRPYRLKRASAAELEEAIATVESPPASAGTTDKRIARQLRGDLDAILNKALKKRLEDRYPTMDAFADDLRRWRDGEPVQARPDGLRYRTAKFVGRYRLQVAAGTLVVAALVGGATLALWQAREAQRAAATAEAVQGFIESVFIANSDDHADAAAARATTARELLDRGADRIERELASAPEAQLRLYRLLARMYAGMSLDERVVALQRRSLALSTRLYGARSDLALDAAVEIGVSLEALGRRDEALATLLPADAAARGRRHDDDHARMMIDTALALVYLHTDLPLGLQRARHAAALARAQGPSTDGIDALYALGDNAKNAGHLDEARLALAEAVDWIDRQGAVGELPVVLASLGVVQGELGQLDAAGATLARAVELADRSGEPGKQHAARFRLARFQYENRLLHEALDTAGAEAAWARGVGRGDSDLPAAVMGNYGRALVAYGDAEHGLAALDEARALLTEDTPDRMAPLLAARADALVSLGLLDRAGADIERAMSMTSASGDQRLVEAVRTVKRRYWSASGKAEQARQDLDADPLKAGETNTPNKRLGRQAEEATLSLAAGHDTAARNVAADVLSQIERLPERRHFSELQARMTAVLGEALLREDRATEALPVLQQALALHLAQYDPEHSPATAKVRLALAEAERRTGR